MNKITDEMVAAGLAAKVRDYRAEEGEESMLTVEHAMRRHGFHHPIDGSEMVRAIIESALAATGKQHVGEVPLTTQLAQAKVKIASLEFQLHLSTVGEVQGMNDKTKWENAHFEHDANPVDGSMYKPAAAQEAVAVVSAETYSSDGTSDIIKPNLPIGTKLYAAPVAAAPVVPVDSDAFDYLVDEVAAEHGEMLDDGGPSGWSFTCEDLVAFAKHLMSDYEAVLVADAYAIARAEAKRDSTPAAPGIDLEQFREAVEYRYSAELAAFERGCRSEGHLERAEAERRRLLALIDASPKGG